MEAATPSRSKIRTTPKRSSLMRRVRRTDTPPEMAVRRLLHGMGVRFRVQARDLPGTPDIVNRSRRWAIFVHGCYWHAHAECPLWRLPKRNTEFWAQKFEQNRERDQRKREQLENLGFEVLVVWQCEIEKQSLRGRLAKLRTCTAREGKP